MPNLGANFYPKLVQIASEVGMKPEDLIAVMVSESGMNPSAVEKKFKGSGLVGFMPDTLKGLGFKGTWEDFIKLSGEEQLDYLKKLLQNFSSLNGGPMTSAAQYYTANLWPVALKLPGVKQGNAAQPILESNPEVVKDPKTGTEFSKKYYDIGSKIPASMERNAYKYNPLFDRDKKGSITYGDMMKQVEINKQSPVYQKALVAMRDSTNYQPGKEEPSMVASKDKDDFVQDYMNKNQNHDIWDQIGMSQTPQSAPPAQNDNSFESLLNQYMQEATKAASDKRNKKLYKQYLPAQNVLIRVHAGQHNNSVEFARVLCTALDEELMASAFTHTDGNSVEVECTIHGPELLCFDAIKQLTASLTEAFKIATAKIGGLDVKTYCFMNKKSSYQQISLTAASNQHRNFLLKFI